MGCHEVTASTRGFDQQQQHAPELRGDNRSGALELRQTCDNTTAKLARIGDNRWTRWRLQPVTSVSKS